MIQRKVQIWWFRDVIEIMTQTKEMCGFCWSQVVDADPFSAFVPPFSVEAEV